MSEDRKMFVELTVCGKCDRVKLDRHHVCPIARRACPDCGTMLDVGIAVKVQHNCGGKNAARDVRKATLMPGPQYGPEGTQAPRPQGEPPSVRAGGARRRKKDRHRSGRNRKTRK